MYIYINIIKIFSQPKVDSSAWVTWRRILLLDVGYSRSHSLYPGKHSILQRINVGPRVESEAIWEAEWKHNVTIVSDHPKLHDVDWIFGFHHYQYILWGQNKPTVVLWVHYLILAEIFSSKKKNNKICSVGGDAFVYSKSFQRSFFFSCPSWPGIKIGSFSSCMRNSECRHILSVW